MVLKKEAPQRKVLTHRIGKARAFKNQKFKFLKLIAKTVRNRKNTLKKHYSIAWKNEFICVKPAERIIDLTMIRLISLRTTYLINIIIGMASSNLLLTFWPKLRAFNENVPARAPIKKFMLLSWKSFNFKRDYRVKWL